MVFNGAPADPGKPADPAAGKELTGTDKADNLKGTGRDDVIEGRGGNDTIKAGGGDDVVVTGSGNNKVDLGKGDDLVEVGSGNNTIEGGEGYDTAVFQGVRADYDIRKEGEKVVVTNKESGNAADLKNVEAYGFDDQVVDQVPEAPDTTPSTGGPEGGKKPTTGPLAGVEDIIEPLPEEPPVVFNGEPTVATSTPSPVAGRTIAELTDPGARRALDGGTGSDNLGGIVNEPIVVRGFQGNDTLAGGNSNDLIFGDRGNDSINGGAGDDVIVTGSGADTVVAGAGDDVIIAGSGAKDIRGGNGNDTVIFFGEESAFRVERDADGSIVAVFRGNERTAVTNVENIEFRPAGEAPADIETDQASGPREPFNPGLRDLAARARQEEAQ